MNAKQMNILKVLSGVFVFMITLVIVIVLANTNNTMSRIEVIETPNYHVELAGSFDATNFSVGDDNKSNEIFPTKDGGWIASNHITYGQSKLIKYDKNGNKQWERDADSAISKYYYEYEYPNEPDRTTVEITDRSSPSTSDIRHIVEALDGSGYFVQTNNYNVVTKYNNNGEKVWQNQDYDEIYHYTFEKICTYEGNTDSQGRVKTYYWGSNYINGQYVYDWQESGYSVIDQMWPNGDVYKIDDEHYYCGVRNDYYNYRSNYSGYLAPDTKGGVYLIINGNNYPYKLADGTLIEGGNKFYAHHYDANGRYDGVYNIDDLITQGRRDYSTKYNLTYPGDYNGASDLYHAYVGTYPNGDILFTYKNALEVIKIRFNEEQNKFDLLFYNPPGFNGLRFVSYYNSNYDGILDIKLLSNGGFALIDNSSTSYSKNSTKDPWYDTEMQHFDNHPLYTNNEGQKDYTMSGNTTPVQIYNAQGKYDNIIVPHASFTKYPEAFEQYGAKNNYLYYYNSTGNGSAYHLTGDGGVIVAIPVNPSNMPLSNPNYPFREVVLTNGEQVSISEDASFLIYKVTAQSEVEWIKQYKGISSGGRSNVKFRISNDQKTLLLPVIVGTGATDLDTGEDISSLIGGTGKRFLLFNMGFDRQENYIPDPTSVTTTNSTSPTTKKTTKKTTTKKGQTTSTTTTEETTTTETTTTSTTTTSKKTTTTTQKEEVKGDETPKKDIKKIVLIAIGGLGGLFIVGIGFYFIPLVFFGKKKVLIGMSGNTDSAVAAKLLLDRNYKVSALFINNGMNVEGLTYAKQICNKLNIDLYEQDITGEYKAKIEEAKANPNADLESIYNKYILIDMLKEVAKEQKIKYISCGVYARKQSGAIVPGVNNVFDESSKLSLLTEEDIKKLVLPLGDIDYQEVNKIAEENYLNLSNKKQTPEEKIGM